MYIIYVNNTLPLAHEISRHFWAAYGSYEQKFIVFNYRDYYVKLIHLPSKDFLTVDCSTFCFSTRLNTMILFWF